MSDPIKGAVITRAWIIRIVRAIFSLTKSIVWALSKVGSMIVGTRSKIRRVGISTKTSMTSIWIRGDFPLRSILMDQTIIGIVLPRSRISIEWSLFSSFTNCVIRSFSYKCLLLILSRSKLVWIN
jgi:hypothetical protein